MLVLLAVVLVLLTKAVMMLGLLVRVEAVVRRRAELGGWINELTVVVQIVVEL